MDHSRSIASTKRKHLPNPEPSHSHTHRKKRRRKPSKTQRDHISGSSSSDFDTSRKWVFSSHHSSNSYKDTVVVVSYNILGVENASRHPDLYYKVPPKYLDWDRRMKCIREEILRYNAGILCLQEVDCFNDLKHLFQKDGFKGVYKGRTGNAYDGCALFWKKELFTLLHQEHIEFHSFGLRNNVAQLCVFKMNQNHVELDAPAQASMTTPNQSRSFVIGNVHVLFNPNRGDVKLGQVRILLEKAYKLAQDWGCIPVMISGDLNSIPQSPIYQFLASSQLDIKQHDRRKISGQVEFESALGVFRSQKERDHSFSTSMSRPPSYSWSAEELRLAAGNEGVTHLQHPLKLCSAYHGVPGNCKTRDNYGEPLATSYHSKFMGTVDYIWHTKELVPLRVLETLPIDVLERTGGLPSKKWGSDHLALVCELAFWDECSMDQLMASNSSPL